MNGAYDLTLVFASYVVASFAAYLAFSIASWMTVSRHHARAWLAAAAIALGTGLWSMHFIGMIACQLPFSMSYDPGLTLLSLSFAIGASALALHALNHGTLSRTRLLASGALMGLAISAMHYTGVAAMRIEPVIRHDLSTVVLSLVVALLASCIALELAFRLRSPGTGYSVPKRIGGALVMGLGITGMHYIGTAAIVVAPEAAASAPAWDVEDWWLAVMVGCLSMLLTGGVMLARPADGAAPTRALSIRIRIGAIFMIVATMVVAFVLATLLIVLEMAGDFAARDARNIATAIAQAGLGGPVANTRETQQLMDRLLPNTGRDLIVIDAAGKVVAASRTRRMGAADLPAGRDIERTLADGTPRTFAAPEPGHATLTRWLVVPVLDSADSRHPIEGAIVVDYTRSYEMLREEIRDAAYSIAGIGVAVVLAITLLGRRVVSIIVPRLVDLRRRADALASGDFTARVRAGANDEIGVLAKAFNTMAEDLERSCDALLEHQHVLEQRVASRTAELASAEEAQRGVAAELRLVTEHIPVGMCYVDREWRLRQYNRRFAEMARLPAIGAAGGKLEDLLAPEHYALIRGPLAQVFEGREVVFERDKVPGVKDSGRVQVTLVPQRGPDDSVVACFGMFQDVSERKRAEDALRHGNEELLAINRKLRDAQRQLLQAEKMASIGQLASGVAHEINNPIGYVYSNLGTLEHYLEAMFSLLARYEAACRSQLDAHALASLDEASREADIDFVRSDVTSLLSESKEGVERVRKIVADLRNFSRASSDEKWQWADLLDGLDSTLNIVMNEIKYKAEIRKEYGNIPPVQCRPSQLNQVFMNMLVNAADALDSRGTIVLRTGVEGDRVWVEFEDSGCGIAPENLDRIFEPFFTTKPVGKGTGLGLAVSYGIVLEHHGRIDVRSVVGKGTTFRICLPVRQAVTDVATVPQVAAT